MLQQVYVSQYELDVKFQGKRRLLSEGTQELTASNSSVIWIWTDGNLYMYTSFRLYDLYAVRYFTCRMNTMATEKNVINRQPHLSVLRWIPWQRTRMLGGHLSLFFVASNLLGTHYFTFWDYILYSNVLIRTGLNFSLVTPFFTVTAKSA